MAAIGGPITLGIAGIAVLSLAGFSVIGGNWRKTLAKQIHKKLVTEILFRDPAQSKAIGEGTRSIPESLESYWTDLRQSLDRAMREAKKAYQELYDSQPDIAALKDLVESLDTAQTWLSRITFDDLTIASS